MNTSASGPATGSTALLTDQYELTMLGSALADGTANRHAVFEVFARRLPGGRRYGVVAGTGRLLEALERFRFDPAELEFLSGHGMIDDTTASWLADYRFGGSIWGYPEGECYFPGSPILVVEGTFAEAVLLETLTLSILNYDVAIATAASRMSCAAGDRPLIEMGSRRTHEWAAPAAARAAYVGGFQATSNLEAGRRFGIPTAGTAAHAFTLLHDTEREAFDAQVRSQGSGTTLLIDTYDVSAAVATAVQAAGTDLGAVRIDSGDLPALAHQVRGELDGLGATGTEIVVSGDLDEFAIAGMATAPVDRYGVGTSVVTGSRVPTAQLVYKLVARSRSDEPTSSEALVPVAKTSTGKPTHKGRKWAFRRFDEQGRATLERVSTSSEQPEDFRAMLVPLVSDGKIIGREPLDVARERHARSLAELPPVACQLSRGEPTLETEVTDGQG